MLFASPYIILNYADIFGPLIAISAFFYRNQKLSDEIKVIFAFCMVQFICNTLATYIEVVFNGRNYWVYKVNTVLSFGLILLLFARYLLPVSRLWAAVIMLGFIILNVLPVIRGDGITSFNSTSAAMSSLVIVGCCLYYFYAKLLHSSPENSVPSTIIFWCIVGIFTYYAGGFFIFISYKFLIENEVSKAMTILWKFHNLLLLICCIYIAYGVLCKNYQTIQS